MLLAFCGSWSATLMERTIPRLVAGQADGGDVWRIELAVEDRRDALRDYCLRLGASAEIDEAGTIEASFPDHIDDDLEPYLQSWSKLNEVQATVTPLARREQAGGPPQLRAVAGAQREAGAE